MILMKLKIIQSIFKILIVLIFSFFYKQDVQAQNFNFEHDGIVRQYILHIPEGLDDNAPLVFVMHGYSGDAYSMREYCGMDEIADENKFALCYPRGTRDEWNNRFWEVGYEFHQDIEVDDVSFISELASYLQESYNLDTDRTFATGMSNGADMSFLLACEVPQIFRAIAPVCGTIMTNKFGSCSSPIPVMAINGTKDDVTWYEGDPENVGEWGPYLGTQEIIDHFVELNNSKEHNMENLENTTPNDGSTIEFHRYFTENDENEVWFYKVINGGHDWPGAWGNKDINASVEIWKFFDFVSKDNVNNTIEEDQIDSLYVFPNPNKGLLININYEFTSNGILSIINSNGIPVYTDTIYPCSNLGIKLDKKLKKGTYYLQVSDQKKQMISTFIVE